MQATQPSNNSQVVSSSHAAERLRELVQQFNLPSDLEPAKDSCHIPPGESFGYPMTWDDPTVHGLFLIYSLNRFFSPADFDLLKAAGDMPAILMAVDRLVGSPIFNSTPLVRSDMILAVLKQLKAVIPASPSEGVLLGSPIANTDGLEVHEVLGRDPRVAPFWNNCRECHLQSPIDFSSAKSDAEILKVISNKQVAEKMLTMLEWEKNPPAPGPMPRKGSRQYKALLQEENSARLAGRKSEREKMLDILRGFIGG